MPLNAHNRLVGLVLLYVKRLAQLFPFAAYARCRRFPP